MGESVIEIRVNALSQFVSHDGERKEVGVKRKISPDHDMTPTLE